MPAQVGTVTFNDLGITAATGGPFLSSVFVPRGLAHADNWVLKGIIFARYNLAHSISHSC